MASISEITNYTTTASTTAATSDELGKEAFLEMLVAQLKYQDPLNPMEGTDFTAQLAQFSSLEALQNIQAEVEGVRSDGTQQAGYDAIAFVGKYIEAEGNEVVVDGTGSVSLSYELASDTAKGVVSIYASDGSLAKVIDVGSQDSGLQTVTWDCSDASKGTYTFEVWAQDAAGESVTATTYISGTVTGVAFNDGETLLSVGGRDIPVDTVISVAEQDAS